MKCCRHKLNSYYKSAWGANYLKRFCVVIKLAKTAGQRQPRLKPTSPTNQVWKSAAIDSKAHRLIVFWLTFLCLLLFTPVAEAFHDGDERLAQRRQTVFDLGRNLGVFLATDEPVCLELA